MSIEPEGSAPDAPMRSPQDPLLAQGALSGTSSLRHIVTLSLPPIRPRAPGFPEAHATVGAAGKPSSVRPVVRSAP